MDKPKSKDLMLAAGKKRLQQFRKEKKNKTGSGTAYKPDIEVENLPKLNVWSDDSKGASHLENTKIEGLSSEEELINGSSDDAGSGLPPEPNTDTPGVEVWTSSPHSEERHIGNQGNSSEWALVSGQPGLLTVQIEELNKIESLATSHSDVTKQLLTNLADQNAESAFGSEMEISRSQVVQADGSSQLFQEVEKREEQTGSSLEVYSVHRRDSVNKVVLANSQLGPFTLECEALLESGLQSGAHTNFVNQELQNPAYQNGEDSSGLEGLKSWLQVGNTLQPEGHNELIQEAEHRSDQTASDREAYSVHMNSSSNESIFLPTQLEPYFQTSGEKTSEASTGLESQSLLSQVGGILQAELAPIQLFQEVEQRDGLTASSHEIDPLHEQESVVDRTLPCTQPEPLTAQFKEQSQGERHVTSNDLFVKQELHSLARENLEAESGLEKQKSCLEVVGSAKVEEPTQSFEEPEMSEKQTSSILEMPCVQLHESANENASFPHQPELQSVQLGTVESPASYLCSVKQALQNGADENAVAGTGVGSPESYSEGRLIQEVEMREEQISANPEVYPLFVQESANERVMLSSQHEPQIFPVEEPSEGELRSIPQCHSVKQGLQSLAEENAEAETGLGSQKLQLQVGDNVQTGVPAQLQHVEKKEENKTIDWELNPIHVQPVCVQESTTEQAFFFCQPEPLFKQPEDLSKSDLQVASDFHFANNELQDILGKNDEAGTVPQRQESGLHVRSSALVEEPSHRLKDVENGDNWTAMKQEITPKHVQESANESTLHLSCPEPLIALCGEQCEGTLLATSEAHCVKQKLQNLCDEHADAVTELERQKSCLQIIGGFQVDGPLQLFHEAETMTSNLKVHFEEQSKAELSASALNQSVMQECQKLAGENDDTGTGLKGQTSKLQVGDNVQAEKPTELFGKRDKNEELTVVDQEICSGHVQESAGDWLVGELENTKVGLIRVIEENARVSLCLDENEFSRQKFEEECTELKTASDLLQEQSKGQENRSSAYGSDLKTTKPKCGELISSTAVNVWQQQITEEDAKELSKVESSSNEVEFTLGRIEKDAQNAVPASRQVLGVSTLIKAFEAKANATGGKGNDRSLSQELRMESQGDDVLNGYKEDEACIGASRQAELKTLVSQQRISELETKLDLVVEENEQLLKQIELESSQVKILQMEILELQNKSADRVLHWQSEVEGLQRELSQLRESEEEKACLMGALRQVELDKLVSQQHIGDLEGKLALMSEENNRLGRQIEWDASRVEVLEQEILELQNKSAEQALHWQCEVEGLQRDLSQLRESEEEKLCLMGALRQVESDKLALQQHIGDLEAKVALMAEENTQLVQQIEWDSSQVEVLQKEILEIQNKSAEHVQAEVAGLKQDLLQHTLALQAERESYLKALLHAESGFQNAVVCDDLNNLDESDTWNGCSGSQIEMAEVKEKIEELKSAHEQLEANRAEVSRNLVMVQQDRDAAIRMLVDVHKKLQCFSPLPDLAKDGKGSLLEHLQHVEVSDAVSLQDGQGSAVDINDLYHQCGDTIEDWCNTLEEKLRLEDVAREMKGLLSIKETEIEDITFKYRTLSEKCALMCSQVEKADEEQNAAAKRLSLLDQRIRHLILQYQNGDAESLIPLEKEEISGVCQEVHVSSVDLGHLFQECNSLLDKLETALEESRQREGRVRELEALLSTKDGDIEMLKVKVIDLSQSCDCMSTEAIKAAEENLRLIDDLKTVQMTYSEQEKSYLKLCSHVNVISDKVSVVLTDSMNTCNADVVDCDVMSRLDFYVSALLASYESTSKELRDLSEKDSKAVVPEVSSVSPLEEENEKLQALLDSKEVNVTQLQEQLLHMTSELDKERESRENKDAELRQAEQKLLAVKEKLSLAVTKGKGLVQQRDALKHLLAEKTAELEEVSSFYKQELQLKTVALYEAEMNSKVYAESGERVEALESELSYIRNSANALRESFLQKDAVLQRIEELVEDASLPGDLQHKEITEKIECLIEACNQKQIALVQLKDEQVQPEGLSLSSVFPSSEAAEISVTDSVSQRQEIEDLNRKNEDLLRKYRSMAEQSAMLEQSLLERNRLVLKWEEVLDTIDMPNAIRSREPEDRIEWLGRAVTEGCLLTTQLQNEVQSSQETIETLNTVVKDLQEKHHVLAAELAERDIEIKKLYTDFEDMSLKCNTLSEPPSEASSVKDGKELSQAELSGSQHSHHEDEVSNMMQLHDQFPNLEGLVTNMHTAMVEVVDRDELERIFSCNSVSMILENSIEFLLKNCKCLSLEVADLRHKVTELSDLGLAEKEREKCALLEQQIQAFQEELVERGLEARQMVLQIEELDSKRLSHEDEIGKLLQKVKSLTDELVFARDETARSQLETHQADEKLASVREKLSMAVKKGKSVVQQRDALKESLDEKTAELDLVKQKHQAQILALDEMEEKLKHLTDTVERVGRLELELSACRDYAASMEQSLQERNTILQKFAEALDRISASGAPRSTDPVEKILWLSQALADAQKRAVLCEQETKKSKNGAELLALELEEVQGRMDALNEELMHAEKKLSILTGEKKAAETAKAEAGLRLEHAMANVNSLLFELSELRESKVELERENNSLKDGLAAHMGEIRRQQVEAEKNSTGLRTKLHSLKQGQGALLETVADEIFRLMQEMRRAKMLAAKLSEEFSSLTDERSSYSSTDCVAVVEKGSFDWRSEATRDEMDMAKNISDVAKQFSSNEKNGTEGWETSSSAGSLRKLCEELENELQLFGIFFKDFMAAPTQDSLTVSQLLLETCSRVQLVSQTMESLKRDAKLVTISEAWRKERDREIMDLQMGFKRVTEGVRNSVEKLELLKVQLSKLAQGETESATLSFQSLKDDWDVLQSKDWQELASLLVERLWATVQDVSSFEQVRESKVEETILHVKEQLMLELTESEQQCADLKIQLGKLKAATDMMHQQRQLDELKINELEKASEELEASNGSLQRTQQELNTLQSLLSTKNQEEEELVQALDDAETKVEQLSAKVEELEKAMEHKQLAIRNLETSRGKALSKLSTTLSKLDDLRGLSEGLLAEVENLHSLLESRDMQVYQLREEINNTRNEFTNVQKLFDGKTADLSQFHKLIQDMNAGINVVAQEVFSDARLDRGSGDTKELLEVLDKKVRVILAGNEGLRAQLARKDALLQDTQMRHDEMSGKVQFLQAALQDNQAQIERLKAQSSPVNGDDSIVVSTEVEEMGKMVKRTMPPNPIATHVRGARKISSVDHLALDVDIEANRSLLDLDDDDKGHVFKPLTSSRLVPRATRILVDRIDGFWVAGERLLMRKPEARLGVIVYWLALHVWMVMLLL